MALVILGMAAAGVLLPVVSGASVQAEGLHSTLAAVLANDLVEQVVHTPFDQIVGVWNNHTELQGQIKDASGTVFTDPTYANFSRDVICQSVYVPQEDGTMTPNFIRATVRVFYQGRQIVSINRLISR